MERMTYKEKCRLAGADYNTVLTIKSKNKIPIDEAIVYVLTHRGRPKHISGFRGYRSIKAYCIAEKIDYQKLRLMVSKDGFTHDEAADMLIHERDELKKAVKSNKNIKIVL